MSPISDPLTVLGIESSCDDTAASVVRHAAGQLPNVLSFVVHGQTDLHAAFGGVVPEVAARAHSEYLDHCTKRALEQAGVTLQELDAIAVTAGPGLIGGVLSGVSFAKGLAAGTGKPLIGINHLAGHALTARMTDGIEFPYLSLLVSGGHCQFLAVLGADEFIRLGGTLDDAPGEAFDKSARQLGLAQPGGPEIERVALRGNPARFDFPRPLLDRPGCNMSFSGLKTALIRTRDKLVSEKGALDEFDVADLCAGFQIAISDTLCAKAASAAELFCERIGRLPEVLAVSGGVAANSVIRSGLSNYCRNASIHLLAPPQEYCTDNGAMIAWVGIERLRLGLLDGFDLQARSRWPLDVTSPPLTGSGKKGAKS